MHQVLSYETAVRANSSREYGEYVTKRTCVSLVLTIAFFTLISGYLLGTFVAERKQHMRQMIAKQNLRAEDTNTIELSSNDYILLQELHSYQKTKDTLLASAMTLSRRYDETENYVLTSFNTIIFNKYISCTQHVPPNTTIETSLFIEQLIDNTADRQRDCLRIIQVLIDSKLESG